MSLPSRLGRLPISRVVAIFVIATILPLALLTYMSVTVGDHGLRGEERKRLSGVATAGGKFVNQEMNGLSAIVDSYATRITPDAPLSPSADRNNQQLAQLLNDLLVADNGTSVTFLTDPSGHLVAGRPDQPANVGQDFSFRDWYHGVTTTGHTYVSDAFVSAAPGNPEVIAVAAPMHDKNGAIAGYIGANYSLNSLQSLMSDFAKSQNVNMTVVDKQGNIVAAPGSLPTQLTSIQTEPGIAAALQGVSSVTNTRLNNRHVLAAYSPVQQLGWAVRADVPAQSALAPVTSLRATMLSSAAILGLVVIAGLSLLVLSLRERARVESELRDAGEETRSILNASADAYIKMDEHGRITSWSEQAERTFGWSADEVVGKTVAETVIPDEYRDRHRDGLAHYLQTGEGPILDTRIEVEALHKDGHRFPLEISIWAVNVGTESVFNAFCHDITDRHRAAQELADARDSAMEASLMKSEFVANMSHEIRTPMNGVIGMTALLMRTNLTKEQREYTETVSHSAEALLDVINDILDFSKIEAGRMELDNGPFDLRAVVEGAGELLAGAAQIKGLELNISVDPDVPTHVLGDPNRLRQILLNLGGNAVKFTENGEVSIACRLVELSDTREQVRFEVTDTGPGIREEDKERLFQSFMQLDTSSTRHYGGTGLGLVISKRLVELMDGEVGVESTFGEGSTFWFTASLERHAAADDDVDPQMPAASIANLRVLVVDDNATNQTILKKTFESWHAVCTVTSSANEALDVLHKAVQNKKPFELAVIDYNMADTNGIELGRRMSADPSLAPTKRILLTSSGERGEAAQAINGGFVGYLTKPVRQAALFNCILDAVGERKPKGPSAPKSSIRKPITTRASRILLAEDNVVNQNVTSHMLQKMGYEVDVVSNGREALEMLDSSYDRYALVLMDCQMPEVDGYEATRMWRAREPENRHLLIVAITAHAMEGDAEKCLQAGMDDYLSKPVAWDILEARLLEWLPAAEDSDDIPSESQQTLDITVLDSVLQFSDGGNTEVANNLISMFIEQVSKQIDALSEAADKNSVDEVRAMAHRLKGSCGTFGANHMVSLCLEIEDLCRQGDPTLGVDLSPTISALRAEYEVLQQSLRQYMQNI